MVLEKLERYVSYIDYLQKEDDIPFDELVEKYTNSNDAERVKMLFELSDKNRNKIKSLVDGGLL